MARLLGLLVAIAAVLVPLRAAAQACCAGATAVTPGRLALHEVALVGGQVQARELVGSFDAKGHFSAAPPGTAQWDFQEDVFASLRVLHRGQVSLLVPLLESWRRAPTTGAELGGGLGDVNLSARYDFTWGREVSFLPGIAALLGVTLPTGRAPESASLPLGSDATGLGAAQLTAGLALEHALDRWLLSATALVGKRAPRRVSGMKSELGAELVALAALAYVFPSEASLAAVVTGRFEGPASLEGTALPGTARRLVRTSVAFGLPLSESCRTQGSLFTDLPISPLGKNQLATSGVTLAVLWTFR